MSPKKLDLQIANWQIVKNVGPQIANLSPKFTDLRFAELSLINHLCLEGSSLLYLGPQSERRFYYRRCNVETVKGKPNEQYGS